MFQSYSAQCSVKLYHYIVCGCMLLSTVTCHTQARWKAVYIIHYTLLLPYALIRILNSNNLWYCVNSFSVTCDMILEIYLSERITWITGV
jgi:hypothetical protein